ncbi:hypothetical protein NUU61_001881 [Penicillium alfredii]|uniref:Deoxyribonuclease NucA/NucB domain-containing protein n=1 Tax=Penicillium alfredii TaxID=1506179 RepID=A0A9W9KFG7_9EURO|nr:uncharacterized protein NUU61_001881 [Penicillium alfredii]KAJ5104534.1 hypothetical protein NUU61_001881 [Penicillium alfredii]
MPVIFHAPTRTAVVPVARIARRTNVVRRTTKTAVAGTATTPKHNSAASATARPGRAHGDRSAVALDTATIPSPSGAVTTGPITAAPKPNPATEDLPAQATTQTIRFVYDGERMETVKEGKYTGEKYKAPPKAVMQNMCEGIKKLTGSYSDKATLTKASNKQRRRNRRKMCTKNGKSVCTNAVNKYIEKFYPNGKIPEKAREAIASATDLQCDEFPFARTKEGGSLESGTTICVPSTDNGWQGTTMSPFFRGANKIKSNERFTIELVGWDCEKQAPKASSRREFNLNATVTGSDAYRGFDPENPKLKALIMPLGDLDAGSYSINLTTVSGTVNASIRTYDGESYETTQGPHGEMLFTLPEDEFAVSLVGTTMDDDVKVIYEAKQVKTSLSTSTKTSPTQPTPTQNLALMNSPVMKGGLVFWCAVFGIMAVW